MKLSQSAILNKAEWEEKGFSLPQYDREVIAANTAKCPKWIHLGGGNIFRAFPANLQQNLLNRKIEDTGIIVAEGYDYEIINKAYQPKDNLSVLVTLKSDGSIEKTVIGSIMESLRIDPSFEEDWARLKECFASESLQMVSATITEKGYVLANAAGEPYPGVSDDLVNGPERPVSYMGKVAALLYHRYQSGKLPVAFVSMDNCSHNGDRFKKAIVTFAEAWKEKKLVEDEFLSYVTDSNKVSFPCSMIDKITPRPDDSVKGMLTECGFEDVEAIVTSKNTYVAPFVNAEEPQYLVIEDLFPNGKPELEKAGVIFTDLETVEKVEKMKVSTCLNPLHTALAVFGCLLGYNKIADEMKDAELKSLVENIGYVEGLPVVVNPGIISPKAFIDEVLQVRIPNPFMPDTPQRIATDTSQKLGVRFGETIKAYAASETLNVADLKLIPLVLAGWLRYLMAVDDNGDTFTPSSDPLLKTAQKCVEGISLGDTGCFHEKLMPLLANKEIFAVDLYEVGLGERVESLFGELIAGPGAVRETLKKYVNR